MFSLLPRLRRITSGSSWIPEIDGLRFVAIAAVVLYHLSAELYAKSGRAFHYRGWYSPLTTAIGNGHIGVPLFFVISGFILGRPFARQYLLGEGRVSLRQYFLRRLTRLEPPYLLALLLFGMAVRIYLHRPIAEVVKQFAVSAVYLHWWLLHGGSSLIPVAWTLEVEVQFYLLVPLLTLVFRIPHTARRRILLAAATLGWAWLQGGWVWRHLPLTSPFWQSILFFLQYFLAGLLLSDFYVLDRTRWRAYWGWDVASAGLWGWLFLWQTNWLYTVQPLVMMLACMGALRSVGFRRFFRNGAVAVVGGMCYSIYLWHFFVIALVFKTSRRLLHGDDYLLNLLIQCAAILPWIMGISVLYFVLVERPCMDPLWPQKLKAVLRLRAGRLPVSLHRDL